jgi:hypothetical protein
MERLQLGLLRGDQWIIGYPYCEHSSLHQVGRAAHSDWLLFNSFDRNTADLYVQLKLHTGSLPLDAVASLFLTRNESEK